MTTDALFARIDAWHGDRPARTVLDAGTGRHSLGWLASRPGAAITAITADNGTATALSADFPRADVLLGRWSDDSLLRGRTFDLVIADYLLGAVDGFTPYTQDQLFERLRPHVGGRLYVVGLEPWPDRDDDPDAQAFIDLCKLRDAAFLVSGVRPYREYPEAWVARTLDRSGFRVAERARFPIAHSDRSIDKEWGNATRSVAGLADRALSAAIVGRADALRARLKARIARGRFYFGADYVVAADPIG